MQTLLRNPLKYVFNILPLSSEQQNETCQLRTFPDARLLRRRHRHAARQSHVECAQSREIDWWEEADTNHHSSTAASTTAAPTNADDANANADDITKAAIAANTVAAAADVDESAVVRGAQQAECDEDASDADRSVPWEEAKRTADSLAQSTNGSQGEFASFNYSSRGCSSLHQLY